MTAQGETYTSFTGEGVNVFAAITVAVALRLYRETGIKASRSYTPKAMIAFAERTTGQKFKARDYAGAETALRAWIDVAKAKAVAAGQIT